MNFETKKKLVTGVFLVGYATAFSVAGVCLSKWAESRDTAAQISEQNARFASAVCQRYNEVVFVADDVNASEINGDIFTVEMNNGDVFHYRMAWDVTCGEYTDNFIVTTEEIEDE